MGHQIHDQEGQGEDGTHGDAQDGPGGHVFYAVAARLRQLLGDGCLPALLQDEPGQGQADAYLAQGLQHLTDGGGLHVALALGVAPHTGQQAHTEHRRGQRPDSLGGHGVFLKGRQLLRAEEHQQGTRQAQNEEQPHGGAEDLPLLILPALGMCLAGELGDGQRQARRGEDHQEVVDQIGSVKVGLAHAAQNVVQRELVDRANELDDDHRRRQNGGAAQKGLLFLFRHEQITSKSQKNARGEFTLMYGWRKIFIPTPDRPSPKR